MINFSNPNIKHVMIDIETLGIKPTSAVIQMGFVAFHHENCETKIDYEVQFNIEPKYWLEKNRTVDSETIAWWFKQSDEARTNLFGEGRSMIEVLAQTNILMGGYLNNENSCIWSKGGFDIVILENLFESYGFDCPWKYWQTRDLRTLLALTNVDFKREKNNIAHNALDDVRFQLKQYTAAIKEIYKC